MIVLILVLCVVATAVVMASLKVASDTDDEMGVE